MFFAASDTLPRHDAAASRTLISAAVIFRHYALRHAAFRLITLRHYAAAMLMAMALLRSSRRRRHALRCCCCGAEGATPALPRAMLLYTLCRWRAWRHAAYAI